MSEGPEKIAVAGKDIPFRDCTEEEVKEDMVLGLFLVLSVSPVVRGSEWRKMMIDGDDDDVMTM